MHRATVGIIGAIVAILLIVLIALISGSILSRDATADCAEVSSTSRQVINAGVPQGTGLTDFAAIPVEAADGVTHAVVTHNADDEVLVFYTTFDPADPTFLDGNVYAANDTAQLRSTWPLAPDPLPDEETITQAVACLGMS